MTALQFAPQARWQQPAVGALHGELTADGRNIVLMSAGNDWDQYAIAVRLSKLTALTKDTGTGAVTIPCTWANVVQIGHSFGQATGLAWVPHERLAAWIAGECARRMAEPPELEQFWPPWLTPRDYQVEAARQIAHAGKFMLLDDMGLGKTLTTILGIEQRRRTGVPVFPLIILVPSWEVGDGWDREIRKWMPGWGEPSFYTGPSRTRLLRHPGVRVLITTYATARKDAPDVTAPLGRYEAASVVIDEASLIQNAKAKQSQMAARLARHAETVVLLSGTLITKNAQGAFPGLKALDPGTWQASERYVPRFCQVRPTEHGEEVSGLKPEAEPEFRACLLGQMTRRAKADVLKELPPKIYTVLRPEIPEKYREAYRQMERDMLAEVPGSEEEMAVFDTLSQLTRLVQLASSAADVRTETVCDKHTGEVVIDEMTGLPKTRQVVTLKPPSWKAEVLMEVIASSSEPVAVFTASRQLARITGEHYLKPAGLRYGYVIGQGDGVTRGTRKQAVEDFQAGKLDVIVCTAGAGGLGITLTRAPTAIMLQRPWPLDQALQPEDRIHRLGQMADKVEIIDVVAKGTVDERVRELLRLKAGRLSEFVRDPRVVRELLGGKR